MTTRNLKDKLATASATAKEAAGEGAGAARDTLVDAADRLARTLETEAEATEGLSARVLNGLADGVAAATDGLRDRTLGDLLTGAQDYARRNPGTFAVGAAVAGFALARFLGSSASRRTAEARTAEVIHRIYRDAARRGVEPRTFDSGSHPHDRGMPG
jgi:hypothetical protein